MDPSGAVEARIGASPHGQGLRTTLAQIIADQVGVAPQQVRIVHGDTDRTPYGWGTFASRSLVIAGGASLLAAQKIRKKLLTIASHVLEAAADDIVLENGHAKVLGTDRTVTIANTGPRRLSSNSSVQRRGHAGLERKRRLRSARHLLQCLPRRHRRGRYRDRPRHNRKIPRGGGCRPHHQSDDRRRPGARRHRPRHRQCAVRGDRLRRQRQSADRDARRLHAADRVRNSRRSNCTTSNRRRRLPSPAPKAWAKAAPSAPRPPSSTPSTMRCRRSAFRSTRCRQRRNGSAPRCGRRSGIKIHTHKLPLHLGSSLHRHS